jgi:outer membrane protein
VSSAVGTARLYLKVLVASVFLGAVVRADTALPGRQDINYPALEKMSLKAAVVAALANNHQIKAFAYSVSAACEDVGIARGNLLPNVALEESFTRTNTPAYVFSSKLNQGTFTSADLAGAPSTFNNPGYLNNYQTVFSVQQPIFEQKSSIGVNMAKDEFSAKGQEFERKKEQIVFNVVQAFLMVQTAKEQSAAAASAVNDAKEHLRISTLRYDANLGLYSDTLRASTAVKGAEQKLVSAQKNVDLAKRSLGMLLGRRGSIDADGNVPPIELKDVEYYTSVALSRKDLKAMQTRWDNAKRNIDLAHAGYLPVLGVRGAYQLDDQDAPFGSEGDSWLGTVFLRWDLFDGLRREHESSKARHQAGQVRENLLELENAISYKVYEAYLTVNEAVRKVELSQSALKNAAEGRRLVRSRYENSLSPLVDLLDAQIMLDDARANAVANDNEYRLALANLSFESGTIMRDFDLE